MKYNFGRPPVTKTIVLTLCFGIMVGLGFSYMLQNITKSFWTKYTHSNDGPALINAEETRAPVFYHSLKEWIQKGEEISKKVRVLCWIMTGPANHDKKAKHVKATWGQRCNILLFMSSIADPSLPTIALNVSEGRDNLWAKTKQAFKYVYDNYKDEADWFMKADDDTYVIVENLRYMLQSHNTSKPIYFGSKFKSIVQQGWMSGGAGYVLSKEALHHFVTQGIMDKSGKLCRKDNGGAEDVELGKCMESINVEAGDSRDALGRGRFFPFMPEQQLIKGNKPSDIWFWKNTFYPYEEGLGCCSDSAVTFHYVTPNEMYVMEYMLYHIRPFGIDFTTGFGTEDGDIIRKN